MEHGGFSGSPGTPKFDTQEIHYEAKWIIFSVEIFRTFDFFAIHMLKNQNVAVFPLKDCNILSFSTKSTIIITVVV